MKKYLFIFIIFIISHCSINKVIQHHGVHNLEKKQETLVINKTNKNDIIKSIGPPSTKSKFDDELYIYIERKTSSSKLSRFGKKILIRNNVLILDFNNRGILVAKKFFNKEDMQKINFDESYTKADHSRRSFIYNFFYTLRQKIDDPRGVKRAKN